MDDRQINVRIPQALYEVLEAAAFVEQTSVVELLRPFVDDVARRYERDPAVAMALRARSEHQAAKSGKVGAPPN